MNSDDFVEEQRSTEEKTIAYEQGIVDFANESNDDSFSEDIIFFKYVIEAAWEHNDGISEDEQNLIFKIKKRLGITDKEYYTLEAKIGKYPKPGNILHTKDEISDCRKVLQQKGVIFPIRDANGVDYDIIPEELVLVLRKVFGKDIKNYSFSQLINSKYVNSKKYIIDMLIKANIKVPSNINLKDLKLLAMERLTAHQLLAGFSPNDGLDKTTASEWCLSLKIPTSGTKPELINRIIEYYDSIKEISLDETDERELYYRYYTELANRNLNILRTQSVINKDLECEHKFEIATNYIFEVIFKDKPLMMNGTEHPDGMLSMNDKLIMWDNKSK